MRKEERFPTNLLSTNMGAVQDISASGVRVRCKSVRAGVAVGQVVPLTIRSLQCQVVVQSRVVRVSRVWSLGNWGTTDVSFAFLDAKPALRAAIANLGRFGFIPHLGGSAWDSASPSEAKPRRGRPLPDFYGVLGLTPTATPMDIRRAYHQLARQYHPDTTKDAQSVGMFEALSEAYMVLRDEQKRRVYDAARAA